MTDVEKIPLSSIIEIAAVAGGEIMKIYSDKLLSQIKEFKSDSSPVTLADNVSNILIEKKLMELFPDIPVITEEGHRAPLEERVKWEYFWLVDPLDGTKEFIQRNGEFTVNIALVHRNRPVLGVIYIPATGISYSAKQGEGAFKTANGKTEKISARQPEGDLTAVVSRSHATPSEKLVLDSYGVKTFLKAGSSIKFCMVAEGSADVYYRHNPTHEWDTAAGQIIVECSGGKVIDNYKKDLSYNKPDLLNASFLCVGNPSIIK